MCFRLNVFVKLQAILGDRQRNWPQEQIGENFRGKLRSKFSRKGISMMSQIRDDFPNVRVMGAEKL